MLRNGPKRLRALPALLLLLAAGAVVVSATRLPYGEAATYDLLPDGPTGTYWADGILVGSTLGGRH